MSKKGLAGKYYLHGLFILAAFIFNYREVNSQKYLPEQFYSRINSYKVSNKYDEALGFIYSQIDSLNLTPPSNAYLEAGIYKADYFRIKGNSLRAISILDSLKVLFPSLLHKSEPLSGLYYTVSGTAFLSRGELNKGRTAIETAINIYSDLYGPEDTLIGPCYNKLGNYFYFNKIFDSALTCYSNALKLSEKKMYKLDDKASYLQNIGIIYLELSDFRNAEHYFLESFKIKKDIYPGNSLSLARIYLSVGKFYQNLFSLDQALHFINDAEDIYMLQDNKFSFELGIIYWNKGLIYHLKGDSEVALTYLFNARKIIDSVFVDNNILISSINSDIGDVYKYTGQYEKAIEYYSRALPHADSIPKIKAYRNLASVYLKKNEPDKAAEFLGELLDDIKKNPKALNPETGLTYLYIGEYHLANGSDSALQYFQKAYDILIVDSGYNRRDIAAALYGMGDYFRHESQFYKSLQYYQRSLTFISNSFSDTNVFSNPLPQILFPDIRIASILQKKALSLKKLYEQDHDLQFMTGSLETCQVCMDLLEKIRMNYHTENSQLKFSEDIYTTYSLAVEDCMIMYDETGDKKWLYEAFSCSERGKSIVLLNELKDSHAQELGLVPSNLRKLEKDIKSNLLLFINQVREEENSLTPDNNKLDYYRSNLLIYQKKHDSLVVELEKNYPDYFRLKYDPEVVTVRGVRKILQRNETLIEYTLTDRYIYIFVIKKNGFSAQKIEFKPEIVQNIFLLRDNLDFKNVDKYSYKDYLQYQYSAHELYRILIGPVKDQLGDDKLIIIPDGELNYLSFESLIETFYPSDTINFKQLPYLINKHPVSYAASSSVLSIVKRVKEPALNEGVLALAPRASLLTRSILQNNKALAEKLQYKEELPGAVWEAENIIKIMKGKKLIGEEATESTFKKLASSYDILHFATHTRIDNQNPFSSMLSFNPYGDYADDGVLKAYEIYSLDLAGELAVLSACSTGNGCLQKGEGVISLARAFIHAGMPSVLMSLWDIEDISTGNIIPAFYYLLNKGSDKDIALQMAKINYINRTKPEIENHPAFWSGFVLYGNSRSLNPRHSLVYYLMLAVSGAFIILFSSILIIKYLIFRKKRKQVDNNIPFKFHREDRF